MAKNRYFRIGRRNVDAEDLEEEILKNAQEVFETQIENEVTNIVTELEALLDKIGESSSFRGRGQHRHDYDRPIHLQNSPVIVRKRRDKNGDLSYTIRVDNQKFNILDQGSPARSSGKLMRFPRYKGTMTKPNSLDISGTSVKILDKRSKKAKSSDPNDLDAFFDTGKVIDGWVSTHHVEELKPRNFILSIARKVRGRRRGFIKTRVRRREVGE